MEVIQSALSPEQCLQRQRRVCELLRQADLDCALVVSHENVQYLTGFRPHRLMQAVVCLNADGHCLLVAPNDVPADAAFSDCRTFAAQWHCTLRQEQLAAALNVVQDSFADVSVRRIGVEGRHSVSSFFLSDAASADVVDIDADFWRLRRRKDDDELQMISRAIACTESMYARAREMIRPGVTEIEVFNALHAVAVERAGEPLTALGNDFQCNSPGGPPRSRPAQDGELFILDLGPAYRGYYADNCRTVAVNGRPTDEQQQAWQSVVDVLQMVETSVKPGVSCRSIFQTAQEMLDDYRLAAFCHHLGHGFGLFPHEAPHLNPHWDDVFLEGDVFTAEPGVYTELLRAGIRLEQNYRVTADGVQRLTNFSLEL